MTDLDEHKLGNANKSHISWSYLTTDLNTTNNYIFVFIFKQGKQCKNAELADVGGKLSPSGHQMYLKQALTMYTIVVENVIACFVNVYNCR